MSSTFNVKAVVQPNGVRLSEVHFSIHFPDDISLEAKDLPEYIPIQISVQTLGKWAELSPIVRPFPQDSPGTSELLPPSMFPFFPLHNGFDPKDANEWMWLAKALEEYLLENPHLYTDFQGCYLFAHELFWMAFVAAYPTFPFGAWPVWDPRIAMEGDFISHWVVDRSDEPCHENDDAIRRKIWKMFSTAVEQTLSIRAL